MKNHGDKLMVLASEESRRGKLENRSSTFSHIYVSATPYNVYKDDQSLESPFITFKLNIKMSYVLDKPDKSVPSYISKHDSWHEFEHQVDELTRGFICSLFVDAKIPFPLTNLHWKKHDFDKESIPLMSTDCVVSLILDVSSDMINAARESGLVVPRHEYLAMLKAKEGQEVLHNVEDMIRLQAQGWNFRRSDWEDMANVLRQAGLDGNLFSNHFNALLSQVMCAICRFMLPTI
ncbi:hypothetical protein E1A91_A03G023200v1 [Gossypium mustelinum]|uniref:Uncharacterized protein n=1 Tax=Gossypium mustelinum TaxID=34275 RepID=A0A5D2ZV87_GOSMU|nr:hypothetical protein E1A91_A03G023200v1 [Gossypium mustelinum]